MKNLRNAVIKDINESRESQLKSIQEIDTTLKRYLTDLRVKQLTDGKITRDKAIEIATKKINKVYDKEIEEAMTKIDDIAKAEDFNGITVILEYKRSRTYGYQYKATLVDNKGMIIEGNYTGGCGYDKVSTAIAEVLNQYKPLIKLMYSMKDKNVETNNKELFGYGSGYGILPYFESMVGTSTYYQIAKSLGIVYKDTEKVYVFSI